jgi:formylmethanofuran dehydrogenase subunit D
MITAKTILGNSSYKSNGKNNSFQINYTLKIPKNGSVKLHNKYGNITTSDLFSDAEIKCKYGKIALGRLSGNSSNILVEYCSNSSISFLKNATVTAKYSNLKIGEVAKLDLASDYTDVDIQESDVVKYISKYGNIKIQNVKSLDATGNYLTLKIGELSNNLKLSTKYSNVTIGTINAKANTVNIAAGYTGLNIGFDANYAFDFNVTVKYANFKYDNELEVNSKEDSNNLKKYSGFYKKRGVNNVSIISDYGNVILVKKQ